MTAAFHLRDSSLLEVGEDSDASDHAEKGVGMDVEKDGGLFTVAIGLGPGFDDGGTFGLGKVPFFG